MDKRIKLSVVALLSLGIFASIAPLVRLSITVNLSATENFLLNAMDVAAWAQAELGLGILVGNMPALRPLLEKMLSIRTQNNSNSKRSGQRRSGENYLELEEGQRLSGTKLRSDLVDRKANSTRVYGGTTTLDDNSSFEDHDKDSQKDIIPSPKLGASNGIMVGREIEVKVSRG